MKVKVLRWKGHGDADDLIVAALRSLISVQIVEKTEDATLIVCNYHGLTERVAKLGLHRVPYLRRFAKARDIPILTRPDQTSLFVSAECPVWSRFLQSGCDYGISHEFLPGFDRHCRVPYWYYSIDWSDFGVANNCSKRMGLSIRPEAFATPRRLDKQHHYERLAMVSSHLNGFKAFFYQDMAKFFDIDLKGGAFGRINDKVDFLKGYTFSLCPENLLYPGYCTEKVLEAWACSTLPVTCLDTHSAKDFNQLAFINLYNHIATGPGLALKELIADREAVRRAYSAPLFERPPSIRFLLDFLERVLDAAEKKSFCS